MNILYIRNRGVRNVIMDKSYHRAFGVYGVCIENDKLLVINKNGGPYINRFDLPGGSLEIGENLLDGLRREFLEETGLEIEIVKNLGITDFILPWDWKEFNYVHHIGAYYQVRIIGGNIVTPLQFEGQDSLGALWISSEEASTETSSPLVLKAIDYLRTNEFDFPTKVYNEWIIKK